MSNEATWWDDILVEMQDNGVWDDVRPSDEALIRNEMDCFYERVEHNNESNLHNPDFCVSLVDDIRDWANYTNTGRITAYPPDNSWRISVLSGHLAEIDKTGPERMQDIRRGLAERVDILSLATSDLTDLYGTKEERVRDIVEQLKSEDISVLLTGVMDMSDMYRQKNEQEERWSDILQNRIDAGKRLTYADVRMINEGILAEHKSLVQEDVDHHYSDYDEPLIASDEQDDAIRSLLEQDGYDDVHSAPAYVCQAVDRIRNGGYSARELRAAEDYQSRVQDFYQRVYDTAMTDWSKVPKIVKGNGAYFDIASIYVTQHLGEGYRQFVVNKSNERIQDLHDYYANRRNEGSFRGGNGFSMGRSDGKDFAVDYSLSADAQMVSDKQSAGPVQSRQKNEQSVELNKNSKTVNMPSAYKRQEIGGMPDVEDGEVSTKTTGNKYN